MIVDCQLVPIDTSSPSPVVRLLWHDMQLSEWTKSGCAAVRVLRARRQAAAADSARATLTTSARTQALAHINIDGEGIPGIGSRLFPERGERPVEPVPQQVGHDGRATIAARH